MREIGYKGNKKKSSVFFIEGVFKKRGSRRISLSEYEKKHRKDEKGKYLSPFLMPCAESDDGVFPVLVVSHLRRAEVVGVNIRERSGFFEHFL